MIPSKPWPRPPGQAIDPSIHLLIRHGVTGVLLGCKEVELPVTSEAGLGGHKAYINTADTSHESPVREDPTPNGQNAEVHV